MLATVTALNVDHADGAPYNLSAVGAVRRGRYDEPPVLPFACVASPGIRSEEGPQLGRYLRTITADIIAWAPSLTADLGARCVTAELLASKLIKALDVARNTSGNALRAPRGCTVEGATLPGDADALGSTAVVVVLQITWRFERVSGLSD